MSNTDPNKKLQWMSNPDLTNNYNRWATRTQLKTTIDEQHGPQQKTTMDEEHGPNQKLQLMSNTDPQKKLQWMSDTDPKQQLQ
jgi:hypothetical protein